MVRAFWRGALLAESDETIVVEGNHYFPPNIVTWDRLSPSDKRTRCSWKGDASYYHVEVDGHENRDACWTYTQPLEAAAKIEGYLAF